MSVDELPNRNCLRINLVIILCVMVPLGTKLFQDVFFALGNNSRELSQETLQHLISGGINYCNVMVGAVLPWKARIFRLQLQFFLLYVRMNYCNVTPFLYRFYLSRI